MGDLYGQLTPEQYDRKWTSQTGAKPEDKRYARTAYLMWRKFEHPNDPESCRDYQFIYTFENTPERERFLKWLELAKYMNKYWFPQKHEIANLDMDINDPEYSNKVIDIIQKYSRMEKDDANPETS